LGRGGGTGTVEGKDDGHDGSGRAVASGGAGGGAGITFLGIGREVGEEVLIRRGVALGSGGGTGCTVCESGD